MTRPKFDKTLGLLLLGLSLHNQAGASQSHTEIIAAAREHVLSIAQEQQLNGVSVEPGKLDSRLNLQLCDHPLVTFDNHVGRLTQSIAVGVRCNSPKPWTLYVPTRLSYMSQVVVLKRSLPRGAILTHADITATERPAGSGLSPNVTYAEDAVGKQLTRPLSSGISLTTSMLSEPQVIKRGDTVLMVVERNGVRVSMLGKALQNGAAGDRINLKNVKSNRKVEGSVLPNGTIQIFN